MSSFTERNAAWAGGRREFRQILTRASAPRVWTIEVEGPNIHTTWGQLEGAMRAATETMVGVNLGKKNEMSPEVYALDRAREFARKKAWEGYREHGPEGFLDDPTKTEVDFDNLSESLSFYKPQNSISAGLTKKAEADKVWYVEKRNGLMFVIARGEGRPKLYSRRMLRSHDLEVGSGFTWDDRFPHLVDAAAEVMPPNSILLGELVVERDGADDFKSIQRLSKSLTPAAIDLQVEIGRPTFVVWDVAFWAGTDVLKEATYGQRRELLEEASLVGALSGFLKLVDVQPFAGLEAAILDAKTRGLEGYIVVDPDALYGDKGYNFKGKPERPAACAKLKPLFESDFVAIWDPDGEKFPHLHKKERGERSTKGSSNQGIKSVALYQHTTDGTLTYISNVGVGLSDAQRIELADPSLWPRVWEVAYTERTYVSAGDDTNALTFARFVRERDDKSAAECVDAGLDS